MPRARPIPDNDWGEVIMVTGFFHRVDFGPGVEHRHHFVLDGVCSCRDRETCVAVRLVQTYLADGGEPAPEPPDGFYAVIPHRCCVCGAAVQTDPRLNSPVRGLGWRCQADKGHYWQALGRPKQAACECCVYPFAHKPGSGICRCGKEEARLAVNAPCAVPA